MNAEKIEKLSVPNLNLDNKQMEKKYNFFNNKIELQEKRDILNGCLYPFVAD